MYAYILIIHLLNLNKKVGWNRRKNCTKTLVTNVRECREIKKKVSKNFQTVNERSKSFVLFATYAPFFCPTFRMKIWYVKGFGAGLLKSFVDWQVGICYHNARNTHPRSKAKNANNITSGNSKIKLGKISIERWHNLNIFCASDKSHTHTHTLTPWHTWNVNYVSRLEPVFSASSLFSIISCYFFFILSFGCCQRCRWCCWL